MLRSGSIADTRRGKLQARNAGGLLPDACSHSLNEAWH